MQPSTARLAELDFFRGLVLLIIVVDHIGGSMLSRVTLHTYALCDAAEVFVFLGGYATAIAWTTLAARRDEAAARRRFIRRAWEIYRAFLVTAGLMLLVSAILRAFSIDAPNMASADLDGLIESPAVVLRDILLFRRQPYLASVLPMYAFFALAVPVIIPLARSWPWLLAACSFALWCLAGDAYWLLPAAPGNRWDFNPFAWQAMFTLGALVRCQPIYAGLRGLRVGWIVSVVALFTVLVCAYFKLSVDGASDSVMKRDLQWPRVVNFIALAWLVANMVQYGWMRRLAGSVPWIGAVGRKGLLCFVAGTVISLGVDSVLYWWTDGLLDVPLGLVADAVAIASLLLVAGCADPLTRWFGAAAARRTAGAA
ncbi:OpgC domain-containing protein [Mycetohabitans endofungorum]|uniref:OpgC domain-containing protein n=1 Tax=Mycetohabitans endofungorum TaxID=417203 RepID=UPI002B061457|nr:OpgC domain-containing protein [Mycetohabitans endofungorum]